MKRMWPDELDFILDGAETVTLDIPGTVADDGSHGESTHRQALKVRITQQDYERVWPLAETRYRLGGRFAGKAITLIVNNPHYHDFHPADGGSVESTTESGRHYTTTYVVAYFLLDDVRDAVDAGLVG